MERYREQLTSLIKTTLHIDSLNTKSQNCIKNFIDEKVTALELAWFIIDNEGLERRHNRSLLLRIISDFELKNKNKLE